MGAGIRRADEAGEYWFEEGCFVTEVSNHPGDPGLSVARIRVPPGTSTRRHCLEDTWERYLIVEGEGEVEVGGLEPTRVSVGDVVCIPPGTPQRIRCSDSGELVFYALCSPRFTPACYRDLEED
ncbi:MAG TPA: cupin domain-containing protein [Gammaproteobacteria bacterium]|nr:cupin domain-containing protein [Gammaproteobacteria bacterium]